VQVGLTARVHHTGRRYSGGLAGYVISIKLFNVAAYLGAHTFPAYWAEIELTSLPQTA
jgi:hypothetical protein